MDRRLRRSRRGEEPAPVAAVAPAQTPSQTRRAGSISAAAPTQRTRDPEPPQVGLGGPRTRRSSRPRSAAGQPLLAAAPLKATIKQPSPIKEVNEVCFPRKY